MSVPNLPTPRGGGVSHRVSPDDPDGVTRAGRCIAVPPRDHTSRHCVLTHVRMHVSGGTSHNTSKQNHLTGSTEEGTFCLNTGIVYVTERPNPVRVSVQSKYLCCGPCDAPLDMAVLC